MPTFYCYWDAGPAPIMLQSGGRVLEARDLHSAKDEWARMHCMDPEVYGIDGFDWCSLVFELPASEAGDKPITKSQQLFLQVRLPQPGEAIPALSERQASSIIAEVERRRFPSEQHKTVAAWRIWRVAHAPFAVFTTALAELLARPKTAVRRFKLRLRKSLATASPDRYSPKVIEVVREVLTKETGEEAADIPLEAFLMKDLGMTSRQKGSVWTRIESRLGILTLGGAHYDSRVDVTVESLLRSYSRDSANKTESRTRRG